MRRALLWTLLPTCVVATTLAVSLHISKSLRQGNSRNIYSNAIEVQGQNGRSAAFAKLMHDAGQQCASTSKTLFRGDIGYNAAWTIRCRDTGDWFILIASTGAARIANCRPLEVAGTPCWTRI